MHLQEIFKKAFKEQDWKDDLQIVIQNYGVNEFDVPLLKAQFPSLKTQLLLLFETAKFYGLESRMQLSEMIASFQKVDIYQRQTQTCFDTVCVVWAPKKIHPNNISSIFLRSNFSNF